LLFIEEIIDDVSAAESVLVVMIADKVTDRLVLRSVELESIELRTVEDGEELLRDVVIKLEDMSVKLPSSRS